MIGAKSWRTLARLAGMLFALSATVVLRLYVVESWVPGRERSRRVVLVGRRGSIRPSHASGGRTRPPRRPSLPTIPSGANSAPSQKTNWAMETTVTSQKRQRITANPDSR